MDNMFFESWDGVLQVAILTITGYFTLLLMLRLAGKRTLSKLNEFDFIVSVAIGSILASVVLGSNDAWVEGMAALFLLMFLQVLLSWLAVRSKKVRSVISGQPRLLVFKGVPLESAMKLERITFDDLMAALRDNGLQNLAEADAIILESSGNMSVLTTANKTDDVMSDVAQQQ